MQTSRQRISNWDRRPEEEDRASDRFAGSGYRGVDKAEGGPGLRKLIWIALVTAIIAVVYSSELAGAFFAILTAAIAVPVGWLEIRRLRRLRERVRRLVERKGPLVHYEIARELGLADTRSFRRVLAKMARRGELERTDQGYVLPVGA